jgi:protein SCO1/2
MKYHLCILLSLFFAAPLFSGETHSVSGMVLRTDPVHRSLEVSCQPVRGYMDARVMTFAVHYAKDVLSLSPGMTIDFKLDVREDQAYAEEIRIRAYQNSAQEPMAARQLEILDSATAPASSSASTLRVGEIVPDFTLIDQKRELVTFSGLNGKVVAITFIYSSCALPNFCFRMSNNFGDLHQRFAPHMDRDLILLSITFDPEHDQPETLADYSRTWAKDDKGWHFLTGPASTVKTICREFGLSSWQDEGFLTHTLHTVIVDRQGRVAANLEGNDYTAKQLGDLVEAVMNRTP